MVAVDDHQRGQDAPPELRLRHGDRQKSTRPGLCRTAWARCVQDEVMRHLPCLLCSAALVLAATAGCGGSATAPSSGPPSSQTASQSTSSASAFPLTISRTGGIAGFLDLVVVAGDGRVSVTRKGQPTRSCRLTPNALRLVTSASSQVPWSRVTAESTNPSFPDDLVILVQSPAGGPVRLEVPQAGNKGDVAFTGVFNELLNDLGGPQRAPAASRMCPPG